MRVWIGVACLLAGCAATRPMSWYKPDANDADARLAIAKCRAWAAQQPTSPKLAALPPADVSEGVELGEGRASLEDMADYRRSIQACMAADGWTRR